MEYDKEDVDRQYGATWFLDKVTDKTGVKEDLMNVLGDSQEKVGEILTMA